MRSSTSWTLTFCSFFGGGGGGGGAIVHQYLAELWWLFISILLSFGDCLLASRWASVIAVH